MLIDKHLESQVANSGLVSQCRVHIAHISKFIVPLGVPYFVQWGYTVQLDVDEGLLMDQIEKLAKSFMHFSPEQCRSVKVDPPEGLRRPRFDQVVDLGHCFR